MCAFLKSIFRFIRLAPRRVVELFKTGRNVVTTAASGGGVFASLEEAERRLKLCETCSHMEDDLTCGVCTCHMTIKTKFMAATCPHPDGSRW